MHRHFRLVSQSILSACAVAFLLSTVSLAADDRQPVTAPNYKQASQYSTQYLRQFMYDTSVTPRWIGKTDSFWYSYRTSAGTNWYRVNPKFGTKEPLFDRVKLGALLTESLQKPIDSAQLPLQRPSINDDGTKLKFVADEFQFEFELTTEKLNKLGKAPAAPQGMPPSFTGSQEDLERLRDEFRRRREQQDDQRREQEQDQQRREQQDDQQLRQDQQDDQDQQREQQENRQQGEGRGGQQRAGGRGLDHRNWSPDRKSYVFAKGHNLFYVELKPEPAKESEKPAEGKDEVKADEKADENKAGETKKEGDATKQQSGGDSNKAEKKSDDVKNDKKDAEKQEVDAKQQEAAKGNTKTEEGQKDDSQKSESQPQQRGQGGQRGAENPDGQTNQLPIPRVDAKLDDSAIQLTTDGEEDHSFAGGFGGSGFNRGNNTGSQQRAAQPITPDRKTRPNVTWAKDSKSFYVTRADSRGVQELWVINSLAIPRPTLEKYKYPMPGEERIRTTELYYFSRDAKKFTRVTPRWKDENFSNTHFGKTGDELRFIRRDRLLRNIEFCSIDLASGQSKCLITEGFENANLLTTTYRYLDETNEMVWWSERSGWGHFYLFDRDGKLVNAITSGSFRANRIVDVDLKNRMLYFTAAGREPGESPYFEHLYCIHLDGTGLTLMDPGPTNHRSTLSPSKQFLVDNCSRVDMIPVSLLRDATGKQLMELEKADTSRLHEVGWRLPETFVVKAADGVTDLYGNMWKPFDFDPNKKYPIIAHVYPGPQQEGTSHTFSATAGEQQLAQLGFVVIQVGHRGGAPTRSKAYGSFGYFNLRDYGLADKKAAIEQLAARLPYIDIDRVGIYGHSGGGFMTAAAMMQKPYNDFFKVGVSTSGNHDNNVYNNSWSERYHGLKEVVVKEEAKSQGTATTGAGAGGSRGGGRNRSQGGTGQGGSGQETESRREQNQTQQTGAGEFSVDAADYFFESETIEEDDAELMAAWADLIAQLEREAARPSPALPDAATLAQNEQAVQQDQQKANEQKSDEKKEAEKKDATQQVDAKKEDGNTKKEETSKEGAGQSDTAKEGDQKTETKTDEKKTAEQETKTKFEIRVPTNAELAANLKGRLLLVHGELDNNVHPANTLRLVDALIKANKRFDMIYLPGTRHGYTNYQAYMTQRMYEYFAEHLLGDYQPGADITDKSGPRGVRRQ